MMEGEMGWELEHRWEVWCLLEQDVASPHGDRRERRQKGRREAVGRAGGMKRAFLLPCFYFLKDLKGHEEPSVKTGIKTQTY